MLPPILWVLSVECGSPLPVRQLPAAIEHPSPCTLPAPVKLLTMLLVGVAVVFGLFYASL